MKNLSDIAAELAGYDPQALSVQAAAEFLAHLVQPVTQVEQVPLALALGRTLAHEVISPINVPAHTNSAMDGYAFDGAQLQPGQDLNLSVAGTALAGSPWSGNVGPGQCLKVMTGAALPEHLDTVVPQELVQLHGAAQPHSAAPNSTPTQHITITTGSVRPGDNRRLAGEDLQVGQVALARGQALGPAACGLLASLGVTQVHVLRHLRVAYFSTGDEILNAGEPPRPGAVYDSNRYTVLGLLQRLGCEVIDLGLVRDDPQQLQAAFLNAASQADAIITSGGVSVGEADYTKAMMRQLGDVAFWKIAMRPGRPMAVGRIGQAVLFGLPGNPVAVMVTFLALVRPALLRMMGCIGHNPAPLLRAHSLETLRKKPGRTEYQRGIVSTGANGQLQVRTTGNQGSGVLSSMVQANGLIVLHHDQGNVAAGDMVDVMMFEGAL